MRAEALSEGVEAPAGLGRAGERRVEVRAEALSEGVEAPAGLGRAGKGAGFEVQANGVRACETVIMRPIVQSTFAALWSAVLVFWEAASVEAAHEREASPQPSRRGG